MSLNVRQRTFGHVRPAKIQIRLRIRAVWSESSLGAFEKVKDAKSLHADNGCSCQTAWMHRLVWVLIGRSCQKVRFLIVWLIYFYLLYEPAHDITNRIVRPAKTEISLGIHPVWSESSLSTWRKFGSLLSIERTAKTLIGLGGCPSWAESSLGAHPFLLVLSCTGSYTTIELRVMKW